MTIKSTLSALRLFLRDAGRYAHLTPRSEDLRTEQSKLMAVVAHQNAVTVARSFSLGEKVAAGRMRDFEPCNQSLTCPSGILSRSGRD